MKANKYEILIVDDNPENLRVLSSLLSKEGYRIRVAKDGKQALATIEESEPDLLLMDVQMPKMDGFEVCRRIKKNKKLKEFPIIFISALGDSFNKKVGFEAGAVDYVDKPIDADEVKARVKVHLELKSRLMEIEELKEEIRNKNEQIAQLKSRKKKET